MRGALIALIFAMLVLTACTSGGPAPSPPSPSSSPQPQTHDVPVAIVTSIGANARDISADQARALLADGADAWTADVTVLASHVPEAGDAVSEVPHPAFAVELVSRRSDVVALVPVTAVTPRVRTLTVDGRSPLVGDPDYPITTEHANEPGPVLKTTIVGDIMLARRVRESMESQDDLAAPFRVFADRLASADITVGNLESTLSQNGSATQGGDSFGARQDVLKGLKLAGFDLLGLANNHLGDYGQRAIVETIKRIDRAGFAFTGGGVDLEQARKPAVIERRGISIGFIATDSIGETPAATSNRPGTNRINAPPRTGPLDNKALKRVIDDIAELHDDVDIVIVMAHWGTQYTHVPEKSQRRMARAFADAGADLVVGGHPHWVQGWQAVDDVTVIHSLGNFIFDMDFMRKTMEGIFVEVISWGDRIVAIQPVAYVMDERFTPRPATKSQRKRIMSDIAGTSRPPFDSLS